MKALRSAIGYTAFYVGLFFMGAAMVCCWIAETAVPEGW